MPLHILLILVVAGISGIVLLLHLSGCSKEARLDADTTAGHWLRHYPGETVKAVRVAENGRAALVLGDAGPGLVRAFGADTVARHLAGAEVRDVPKGLRIDFHDFTAPPVTLDLSEAERTAWRTEM